MDNPSLIDSFTIFGLKSHDHKTCNLCVDLISCFIFVSSPCFHIQSLFLNDVCNVFLEAKMYQSNKVVLLELFELSSMQFRNWCSCARNNHSSPEIHNWLPTWPPTICLLGCRFRSLFHRNSAQKLLLVPLLTALKVYSTPKLFSNFYIVIQISCSDWNVGQFV